MEHKLSKNPSFQAYSLLRFVFVAVPLIAGADKFFHFLVDWNQYVSPFVSNLVGDRVTGFMMLVGIIEIIAGLGNIWKPKVFSYIVGLWLLGIIVNLILAQSYYDIALRDLGLSLSAFAFARLSKVYGR